MPLSPTIPERWRQRPMPGPPVLCCSRPCRERTQPQRAPRTPRALPAFHPPAPRHTPPGLHCLAEYRLLTPNSCAELDETRRPSYDPPFYLRVKEASSSRRDHKLFWCSRLRLLLGRHPSVELARV